MKPLALIGAGALVGGIIYNFVKPADGPPSVPAGSSLEGARLADATGPPGAAGAAGKGGLPAADGGEVAGVADFTHDEAAASARKTVAAFAAASTPEEKLAQVLAPEVVSPALTAYYAVPDRNDRFLADLNFDAVPMLPEDQKRGLLILRTVAGAPGTEPLLLFFRREGTAGGPGGATYRLDWETYIQQRDGLSTRFALDPSSPPQMIRTLVERTHLFGPPVGEGKASPMGLKWTTLSGQRLPVIAEVAAGTPLYDQLSKGLVWGKGRTATLEMAWDLTSPSTPRLTATRLVCWEFSHLGGSLDADKETAESAASAEQGEPPQQEKSMEPAAAPAGGEVQSPDSAQDPGREAGVEPEAAGNSAATELKTRKP